ncbi:MAG: hypothetical protein WA945_05605 [Arcobacteraceae bacterium]
MGISKFMVVLVILSVGFLFIDKKQQEPILNETKKPTVSFLDSVMYEITEKSVEQVVRLRQADIYDTKEELFDATIIIKANENSYGINSMSSKNIVKIDDQIFLSNKVNLILTDGINIQTEKLNYNLKTKIVQNDVSFLAIKDGSTFYGYNLFLDSMKEYMQSDRVKLRMKVENDE